MREKIKYDLPYRIDGEQKTRKIEIDFISNRITKDYSEILGGAIVVKEAFDRMSDINTLIAEQKTLKEKGWKDEVKKLEDEYNEMHEQILEYSENDFFDRRYDILRRVMIDNGYKDDEQLMNFRFWDESVALEDLIDFMNTVIYKDIKDKKKAV